MSDARGRRRAVVFLALAMGIVGAGLVSLSSGAVKMAPGAVWSALWDEAAPARDRFVVREIRLPRTLAALAVGAALAASGAALQGLFRNPLADPGLIGITAGGSLGAVAGMVLLASPAMAWAAGMGLWLTPFCAFVAALATTGLVYQLSKISGRVTVAHMLLVGVAMNSLCGALTGAIVTRANDQQLRDLTFWLMGGLGFVTGRQLPIMLVFVVTPLVFLPLYARGLNALLLGEGEAFTMGVRLERLKTVIVLASALSVGGAVAFCGAIGFIGLVAPHLVRLLVGGDHRYVFPGAALMGALLLCAADLVARTVAAPTEMPVGIVTASLGAPFFLFLLLKSRPRT
jgi:iron complex transport system permease protein